MGIVSLINNPLTTSPMGTARPCSSDHWFISTGWHPDSQITCEQPKWNILNFSDHWKAAGTAMKIVKSLPWVAKIPHLISKFWYQLLVITLQHVTWASNLMSANTMELLMAGYCKYDELGASSRNRSQSAFHWPLYQPNWLWGLLDKTEDAPCFDALTPTRNLFLLMTVSLCLAVKFAQIWLLICS